VGFAVILVAFVSYGIELGDEVDHLTAVAIKLSLADLQSALGNLRHITNGLKDAVAHLGEIRKVITVATALVDLGAAIASASPSAVLGAFENTVTSLQS
jgi:hypothetical protein